MFKYSVFAKSGDSEAGTEYKIDGCSDYGYPKDWNVFVEKVNNSISTEVITK